MEKTNISIIIPSSWQMTWGQSKIQNLKLIDRSPFTGLGKPEPLKYELSGFWYGRINDEHRLVYTVTDTEIIIAACKYHYEE